MSGWSRRVDIALSCQHILCSAFRKYYLEQPLQTAIGKLIGEYRPWLCSRRCRDGSRGDPRQNSQTGDSPVPQSQPCTERPHRGAPMVPPGERGRAGTRMLLAPGPNQGRPTTLLRRDRPAGCQWACDLRGAGACGSLARACADHGALSGVRCAGHGAITGLSLKQTAPPGQPRGSAHRGSCLP